MSGSHSDESTAGGTPVTRKMVGQWASVGYTIAAAAVSALVATATVSWSARGALADMAAASAAEGVAIRAQLASLEQSLAETVRPVLAQVPLSKEAIALHEQRLSTIEKVMDSLGIEMSSVRAACRGCLAASEK